MREQVFAATSVWRKLPLIKDDMISGGIGKGINGLSGVLGVPARVYSYPAEIMIKSRLIKTALIAAQGLAPAIEIAYIAVKGIFCSTIHSINFLALHLLFLRLAMRTFSLYGKSSGLKKDMLRLFASGHAHHFICRSICFLFMYIIGLVNRKIQLKGRLEKGAMVIPASRDSYPIGLICFNGCKHLSYGLLAKPEGFHVLSI
jgi:hypothetical protein